MSELHFLLNALIDTWNIWTPQTLDNSDRQIRFQKMKLIKNELSWLASAKKIAIKNWAATGGLQPSL